MQPKARFWIVLMSALMLSLFLAGCGGGSTGSTWFNLPSVAVDVNENGTASVYGLPVNMALLPAATIDQLQNANVQRAEVRWGYNGVHALLNAEDMPYLAWDEASANTLGEVVRELPNIPNSNLIASAIPWLRRIGYGVKLDLPLNEGASALSLPRWRGETSVTPAPAGETTIGPLDISSLNFDEQGNAFVGAVPLSSLGAGITLPPDILAILRSIGVDTVTLNTAPDGLHINLDERAFPTLAYDEAYLTRALALAQQIAPDAAILGTVAEIAPQLPGADLRVAVNFSGEPAGDLNLRGLSATINPDGSLNALGIPIPGGSLVPADTLAMLQSANIQKLDLNMDGDGVAVGVNGQALPAIGWTPEGLGVISGLVGSMTGMPQAQLDGILSIVNDTGLGVSVDLPPAEGVEAIDAEPMTEPSFAPVDLGDFAPPIIRAALDVDASGTVSQIGAIRASDLASVGLPPISLPGNVMDILTGLGANEVAITSDNGQAQVNLDGETAITLDYDAASLSALLEVLKPLLGIELLNDPNIAKLLSEQILPLAPGAQLDLSVSMP